MSEPTPPGVAQGDAGRAAPALTPGAINAALDDFRAWLEEAARTAPPDGEAPAADESPVDLHTLLGQFLALRHEVNLQTRAVRGQQELNAQTLDTLRESLDALAEARQAAPASGDDATRSLLETLVDLYDALALAGREMNRGDDTLGPLLDQAARALEAQEPSKLPAPSLLGRLFGKGATAGPAEQEQARQAREGLNKARQALAALATGYAMSVQRLERAMQRQGLEPIPAVGRPFDPERMEVLEAVADSGRPAGEVLGEVRKGYLWQGRIFRFAQVRVAKG